MNILYLILSLCAKYIMGNMSHFSYYLILMHETNEILPALSHNSFFLHDYIVQCMVHVIRCTLVKNWTLQPWTTFSWHEARLQKTEMISFFLSWWFVMFVKIIENCRIETNHKMSHLGSCNTHFIPRFLFFWPKKKVTSFVNYVNWKICRSILCYYIMVFHWR